MSRSHPIWINVEHFGTYRTSKSFGGKKGLHLQVCVGTSGTNSHHFCNIEIHRESHQPIPLSYDQHDYRFRQYGEKTGAKFTLYIDGHEYKASVVTDKKEYVTEREVVTTLSSDGKLTRLDK